MCLPLRGLGLYVLLNRRPGHSGTVDELLGGFRFPSLGSTQKVEAAGTVSIAFERPLRQLQLIQTLKSKPEPISLPTRKFFPIAIKGEKPEPGERSCHSNTLQLAICI